MSKEKISTFEEWKNQLDEDFYNPFDDNEDEKDKGPSIIQDKGGLLKKKGDSHNLSRIEYLKKSGKGYIVKAKTQFAKGETVEICPVVILSEETREASNVLSQILFELDDNQYGLVLGYGSLYRHSYEPNLDFAYDKQKKQMHFITRRPIKADEELTINYGIERAPYENDFGLIAGENEKRTDANQGMPIRQQEESTVKIQPGEVDSNYDGYDPGVRNDPQNPHNPVRTGRAIKGLGQQ